MKISYKYAVFFIMLSILSCKNKVADNSVRCFAGKCRNACDGYEYEV